MDGSGYCQLFGIFHDDLLFLRVTIALEEIGFRLVRCPFSASSFLHKANGPILVDQHLWPLVEPASRRGHPVRPDPRHWIVTADANRPPTPPGPLPVFRLPDQEPELRAEVLHAFLASVARGTVGIIRDLKEIHPCLKSALCRVILPPEGRGDLLQPVDWIEKGAPSVALRSHLAKQTGISPNHLSRLAKSHGISLRTVFDAWRMACAVVLRLDTGTWERAALLLGFASVSGLSALARRSIGSGLRQLEGSPGCGLDRAICHLMGLLRAEQPGEK